MSKNKEIRAKFLEERFNTLAQTYQSISQQLNRDSNPLTRSKLLRELSEIEQGLENIEEKLEKIRNSRDNDERQNLLKILNSSNLDIADFKKAYQACLPDGWINPIPENLNDIFEELENIPQGNSKYQPLGIFLSNLMARYKLPKQVSQAVKLWVEERINYFPELLSQVRQEQRFHSHTLETHLLVVVRHSQQHSNRYFVEGWLIPDTRNYNYETGSGCKRLMASEGFNNSLKLDEIPHLLTQFIKESERLYSLKNLTLEIFLPLDLIDLPVDNWNIEDDCDFSYSLGSEFKVVVRSCERLEPNYYYRHQQLWKQKWEVLQQSTEEKVQKVFMSGDINNLKSLFHELRDSHIVGLYCTKPPKQTDKRDFFVLMLKSAIPVAFWPRSNSNTSEFQVEIKKILQCRVHELPDVVQQERLNSAIQLKAENHVGSHISLLWEDPNLIPPNITYSM